MLTMQRIPKSLSVNTSNVRKVSLNWSPFSSPSSFSSIETNGDSIGGFNYPNMVQIYMIGDGSCYFHSIAYAYYKPYRMGEINGVKLDRREFIKNLRKDLAMKLSSPVSERDPTLSISPSEPIDEGSRLNRPGQLLEYTSSSGDSGAMQTSPTISDIQSYSPSYATGEKRPYGTQGSIDASTTPEEVGTTPTYYETLSRGSLKEFSSVYPKYSLNNLQRELISNNSVDSVYHEYISNLLNKDIYILDSATHDVYILPDSEIYYKGRDSIVLIWVNGDHFDLVGLNTDKGLKTYFNKNSDFIRSIRRRIEAKTGKRLVIE